MMKPLYYTDCEKYVNERLGGWDNVHTILKSTKDIAGRYMYIECADEQNIIMSDTRRRRWLITWQIDCVRTDCSDVDDPYIYMEVKQIVLKHTPRWGATKRWEKRFAKKKGDKG